MERDRLNDTFSCAEWFLAGRFTHTVDEHLTRRLNIVSYCREIITFRVPADLTDHIL